MSVIIGMILGLGVCGLVWIICMSVQAAKNKRIEHKRLKRGKERKEELRKHHISLIDPDKYIKVVSQDGNRTDIYTKIRLNIIKYEDESKYRPLIGLKTRISKIDGIELVAVETYTVTIHIGEMFDKHNVIKAVKKTIIEYVTLEPSQIDIIPANYGGEVI